MLCLAALAPALAVARLGPLPGTNEQAHLRLALRHLNMTERDSGFAKDHFQPDPVLPLTRRLLGEPMDFPALAGRLEAAARSGAADALWAEVAELLDVSRPAEPASAPSLTEPDWGDLDEDLARALREFVTGAQEAAARLDAAYADLAAEHESELLTSFFVGLLNAEDRPEARAALEAFGLEPARIERVIEEGKAIDPAPAATNDLARLKKVRLDEVIEAGRIFQEAVQRLADRAVAVTNWPAASVSFDTPLGLLVVGSPRDDRHERPALLTLDPGGDDVYEAAAVAGRGRRLSAAVDLGGDDRYCGRGLAGPATALFGAAVLLDLGGADDYEAAWVGQAAAFCGAAWMEDRAGADRYRAKVFGQAAAYYGVAVLRDGGGDDVYEIGLAGQAYAGVLGAALLVEDGGHDRYAAGGYEPDHERQGERFLSLAQGFSIGRRPFAGGGVAALIDAAGNDTYLADQFGQGAGYWYAAGLLIDAGGHDTYRVYQYGQGAGIHLSLGLLADGGGDDFYTGYILAQGVGHDYGVGMLFDQGGDDTYTADHHAQGRALNNAFALLVDSDGDDAYFGRQPDQCQGVGNDGGHREYGSLALLLDLGGRDRYTCGAEDGARMKRPYFGIVYDVVRGPEGGAP